jgi:hypothetical protein
VTQRHSVHLEREGYARLHRFDRNDALVSSGDPYRHRLLVAAGLDRKERGQPGERCFRSSGSLRIAIAGPLGSTRARQCGPRECWASDSMISIGGAMCTYCICLYNMVTLTRHRVVDGSATPSPVRTFPDDRVRSGTRTSLWTARRASSTTSSRDDRIASSASGDRWCGSHASSSFHRSPGTMPRRVDGEWRR